MKIEATVDRMMYGTIKVDIPDEQLRDISKREERAIVWNAVQAAIRNGTPVEWDNITGSVAYHGDYRTEALNNITGGTYEKIMKDRMY